MIKNQINKSSVYAVLLNWNGIQDTSDCLQSLRKVNYPNFKIIVVDNGSEDKTEADKIKQKFPEIQLIRSLKNLGFSGGNNLGIKKALEQKSDFILLLNNDTVVKADFLNELIKRYYSDEKIGAIAPAIFYYNSKKIWPSVGTLYSWLANVRNAKTLGEIKKKEDKKNISFLSGCALLIPRKVFEKIGLLNEDYFAYFEDTELCLKIRKAGFRLAAAPKARIWHKVSVASEGVFSPLHTYYMTRNNLLFIKIMKLWYIWPSTIIFFIYWRILKRFFRIILKNESNKNQKIYAIYKAIFDFCHNRFGKAKL